MRLSFAMVDQIISDLSRDATSSRISSRPATENDSFKSDGRPESPSGQAMRIPLDKNKATTHASTGIFELLPTKYQGYPRSSPRTYNPFKRLRYSEWRIGNVFIEVIKMNRRVIYSTRDRIDFTVRI